MDTRKLIYNKIATDILTSFPKCYVAQVRELTNRKIPCAFIEQISKARVEQYATLANTDEQARLGFEVEVYGHTIKEAYEIMVVAEDSFKSIGFFELSCTPIASGDPSIYRLVSRFSGVTGKAIYEPDEPEDETPSESTPTTAEGETE